MNTKHTPGPWAVATVGNNKTAVVTYDGVFVCVPSLKGLHFSNRREEGRANARLIAAAPELLELAIIAVETHEDEGFRRKAKALIAKATGA